MNVSEEGVPLTLPAGVAGVRFRFFEPPAFTSSAGDTGLEAVLRYPELDTWRPVLDRLGFSQLMRTHVAMRAHVNGVSLLRELHASGIVPEAALYRALADELGVDYLDCVDPDKLVVQEADIVALLGRRPGAAPVALRKKAGIDVIAATDGIDIPALKRRLLRSPALRQSLKITAPSALRRGLFERARPVLGQRAVNDLFDNRPDRSARLVLNGWQAFVLGCLVAGLIVMVGAYPAESFVGFHFISSFFFLAGIYLRFAAASAASASARFAAGPVAAKTMPVYSVLVALHKEAEIVPELLIALGNIVWPLSKLEIKLVCEADDHETLAAIRAQPLRPAVEVIEVPVVGPRTKPKALAYALPAVSSDFVVLYDAEDRPHPLQLIEAWQRFEASDGKLACVQAPLEVANAKNGIIAHMFAFEYAALFRGMLPWLSSRRLLLPLGGTSNHFRRSILQEVGGWDPYNLTEDADLGLRLARFGYRTETIASPTYEDGPEQLGVWLPQRTRWFKGWTQIMLQSANAMKTMINSRQCCFIFASVPTR
ncbi:Glycosyltransferase like family 2 [Mesorhizobium albiziae]|uniref:Glycosyltransferase like family 2 n=1 Tax=Neomesorhizobium albiziae TaxID=335020 RepID=A0A1I4CNY5_9HYPH|nr:glycosyltransferase [Mesorhizobium albiziae]GLS29325.1 hypothetical protein GCM10007937_10330 [Mesorhizobium albiziae]SFK81671.1 Glycosyltransferase like family 2 [Mesorhizobium albiziae]